MQKLQSWVCAAALLAGSSSAFAQRAVAVHIETVPPGAEVFVDDPSGQSAGVTPLRNSRITTGSHTLHLVLDGHEPGSFPATVSRAGETFRFRLTPLGRIELTGEGDAAGAPVRIDGEPVGNLPLDHALRQGRHEVRVSKEGYEEWSQWFEIQPGETRSTSVALERARAASGSLLVACDVPGAAVLVDGRDRGRTPVVVDGLDAGAHSVEIRAEGVQPWVQTIDVEAGQRITVNPRLQPERSSNGSIRVLSNVAGAQVVVDGDPVGAVPADAPELAPGTHIIEVLAPGHEPGRQDVTVEAGQQKVVRVELRALPRESPRAWLRVVSPVPNAQVYLDGQLVGPTPLEKSDLSVGTHFVTVRASGHGDWVRNVRAEAGAQLDLVAELIPMATLRIRANVDGAHVFLDGTAIGRTPFESSSVPAGDHQLEVRQTGHDTYTESLTLVAGQPREVTVSLEETSTGATEEQRRAMMPWAAVTLPVGGVAFDVATGWPYLLDFRFGVGIIDLLDAGVGIRTYFDTTEFVGRIRSMIRPVPAIGMGGEGNIGGGLGPDDRDAFILGAAGLATLFFMDNAAFTLRLDLEASTERYAKEPIERDENLRMLLGGTMEIVTSRYWNVFGTFQGVLLGGTSRRAYENILFFDNADGGLYFKAGFTYKF